MQAKIKTEQCQCAFRYHSSARKRESAIIIHVCVQFSVGLCQHIPIFVHMYVVVCVNVRQVVHINVSRSVCAGREWGSVVCFVCRRPWMLSRLRLGTAMVLVQCRKQQEPATYKLNGRYTLKTSTFTLASSSMNSRAMKQAIDTRIVLGCQSEQEVYVFRFI